MPYILHTLREYAGIAIFLTLALGFWFGSTKVGYVAAKIMGYDAGVAAGLLAGATTNSGTLGVATSK